MLSFESVFLTGKKRTVLLSRWSDDFIGLNQWVWTGRKAGTSRKTLNVYFDFILEISNTLVFFGEKKTYL
jgi:hypothetical protein